MLPESLNDDQSCLCLSNLFGILEWSHMYDERPTFWICNATVLHSIYSFTFVPASKKIMAYNSEVQPEQFPRPCILNFTFCAMRFHMQLEKSSANLWNFVQTASRGFSGFILNRSFYGSAQSSGLLPCMRYDSCQFLVFDFEFAIIISQGLRDDAQISPSSMAITFQCFANLTQTSIVIILIWLSRSQLLSTFSEQYCIHYNFEDV